MKKVRIRLKWKGIRCSTLPCGRGLGMSAEVAENIGRLAEMVVDELTGLGLKVEDVG